MGRPCGYFLGTSFSKICNFNREFKTESFRGRMSIICRSSVAAIYQNKPLSPVSLFNCRNGLLCTFENSTKCSEISFDPPGLFQLPLFLANRVGVVSQNATNALMLENRKSVLVIIKTQK